MPLSAPAVSAKEGSRRAPRTVEIECDPKPAKKKISSSSKRRKRAPQGSLAGPSSGQHEAGDGVPATLRLLNAFESELEKKLAPRAKGRPLSAKQRKAIVANSVADALVPVLGELRACVEEHSGDAAASSSK